MFGISSLQNPKILTFIRIETVKVTPNSDYFRLTETFKQSVGLNADFDKVLTICLFIINH